MSIRALHSPIEHILTPFPDSEWRQEDIIKIPFFEKA
jgi:hypothetical protein